MNIADMEQRYQQLRASLTAGQLDPAGFARAADRLQFQDAWGRSWMIGAQSGGWYCYDGQAWRQADPRQALAYLSDPDPADPGGPEPARPAARPVEPARSRRPVVLASAILVAALALVLWPLLVMPVSGAPPTGPLPAPSPRPPLDEGGGSGGSGGGGGSAGGGGGGGGAPQSAIFGTVTDLSSGLPAAGVEVSVSGAVVRTDSDGSYAITGLPAGSYTVAPQLQGQGLPAQGPVYVYLDGHDRATVDLGYYSRPQPTDTPQAVAAIPAGTAPARSPAALPDAGGPFPGRPLLLMGLGLGLVLLGGAVRYAGRA